MLLNDEIWNKIKSILPGKVGDRGRTASDNRCFVEAVLWIGRTGSPWRDLPSQFGRWHTVYMRFSRWRRKGIWQRIAHVVSGDAEIDQVMIDSTIVRAHQHSAGARRTHGPQAIGRSRGGLTTKLHLAIDANGRPLRLIITEGQVADILCAEELIGNLPAETVIADKGYDADTLVQAIRNAGAKAVIPPRSNRIRQRRYSRTIYRTRNLIERFFARIKHFRRVATRYDKLAESYLVFASLACVFGPLVKM